MNIKAELPAVVSTLVVWIGLILIYIYRAEPTMVPKIYSGVLTIIAFPMVKYKGNHTLLFSVLMAVAGLIGFFI